MSLSRLTQKKVVWTVVLVAALGAALGLSGWTRSGDPIPVKTVKAAFGPLAATIKAEGDVEPVEKVEVRAPASGNLISVKVEEGDRVEKGQLLAVYNQEDLRLAVNQARSQSENARAQITPLEVKLELERTIRQEDLSQAEARLRRAEAGGSEPELAAARADLESTRMALANFGRGLALDDQIKAARAALSAAEDTARRAEADLAAAGLTAPVSGVILSREGTKAGPVARGTILFLISDTSRLEVRARVDEVDIGQLKPGDQALVTHSAFPNREFTGQVTRIAPQARRQPSLSGNSNSITFEVRIEVDNREGLLRPGMSVGVKIQAVHRPNALAVPSGAVVERDGRPGVFILDGDVARFRPVSTGAVTQSEVELTAGLEAGSTVITGNVQTLRKLTDGQRARAE